MWFKVLIYHDGYLICFVQDETTAQSECLILDAQNIAAGPVATILVPIVYPMSFTRAG
ncbi:MAG: hypothetical protein HOF32_21030 [Gammaproteobacteria bacterium]|jgi:carotenoid cleavage dioxygenase-like enzyme|nr:hypothetical protein [Gammaproteobacteria bacterium]MBT3710217.1 hypothetical protein [Gammaproteobacteria bacterium]MBT3736050.1 hypothetical protein [Gammaproteobacteria bacterium]MBT3901184.1 hypothetical protein [Gammaproteobacteria bacterium]MBT7540285.1 hypothetical protein [Gammaproteobacteria bacterium]